VESQSDILVGMTAIHASDFLPVIQGRDTDAAAPALTVDVPTAATDIPAPAPVAPRRSTRTRVPSKAIQDSLESQATEAAAKAGLRVEMTTTRLP
jgi:hypothetical protein